LQNKEINDSDLVTTAKRIVPISATMKPQIDELRNWAAGRAIPAGELLEAQPKTTSKKNAAVEI